MSDNLELTSELDQLLSVLEGKAAESNSAGEVEQAVKDQPKSAAARDAIEAILADAGRKTQVKSLREAPEIETFRRELVNGLIRVDTANQLLRLLSEIVTRVLR